MVQGRERESIDLEVESRYQLEGMLISLSPRIEGAMTQNISYPFHCRLRLTNMPRLRVRTRFDRYGRIRPEPTPLEAAEAATGSEFDQAANIRARVKNIAPDTSFADADESLHESL